MIRINITTKQNIDDPKFDVFCLFVFVFDNRMVKTFEYHRRTIRPMTEIYIKSDQIYHEYHSRSDFMFHFIVVVL